MNIKNIIFDLDYTLFNDIDDDILYYKNALSNLGYNENDYQDLFEALDEYENTRTEQNNFYSKEEMINFVNKKLNRNYSVALIDELNKYIAKYWAHTPFIKESTLHYLYSRYNLYVYTNWLIEGQLGRLKTAGFDKYFKNVFTSEYYGAKPFKNSYLNVLKYLDCNPEECVMIGDSKKKEVVGTINVGMNAILFDYDKKRDDPKISVNGKYIVIHNMEELEKIF